jgi:hypothetical protein
MAKLLHETPPESVRLPNSVNVTGLSSDRRVDHDEPARRIDVHRLAADAAKHEHPPLAPQ